MKASSASATLTGQHTSGEARRLRPLQLLMAVGMARLPVYPQLRRALLMRLQLWWACLPAPQRQSRGAPSFRQDRSQLHLHPARE